jgi:hypothetical protein
MNLMEAILNGKGSPLSKIAGKFGLSEDSTAEVVKQFLPALTNGMKKNISKDQKGLDGLLNALKKGNHDRYLDDPDVFNSNEATRDGNGILGHLFGKKETSRQLARKTADKTGLDFGTLKKMLPLIAGLAMGALKKQGGRGSGGGLLGQLLGGGKSSSSLGGLLSLLDADGDGSPIDDILGFAKKLF